MSYYEKIIVSENDVGSTLTLHCEIDNEDFDLTGYTVTLNMKKRGATALEVTDGACTVTSESTGVATYTWATGNLDTPGVYDVEVKAVKSGYEIKFTGLVAIVEDELA